MSSAHLSRCRPSQRESSGDPPTSFIMRLRRRAGNRMHKHQRLDCRAGIPSMRIPNHVRCPPRRIGKWLPIVVECLRHLFSAACSSQPNVPLSAVQPERLTSANSCCRPLVVTTNKEATLQIQSALISGTLLSNKFPPCQPTHGLTRIPDDAEVPLPASRLFDSLECLLR